jgi:hypothetical protein
MPRHPKARAHFVKEDGRILMASAYRNVWCLVLAAAMFAAEIGAARAQATSPAGQFVAVVGEVRLLGRDGTQRTAERGGELREGDTVVTGANALVQVRLADGGFLSIRADTETTLERFAYTGSEDKNASMLVSLLKGGFRSVTGLIGQLNRTGYRITTPSATIGIRGTDHEPFVVTPATAQALQMAAGTYDRVHSGQTFIQNRQGLTQFANPNQTLFVSDTSAPPRLLPAPPPALYRVPTPVSGSPQPLQADPDRRGPQAGGAPSGDQKGTAIAPGAVRELGPGPRDGLRAPSVEPGKAGTGPAVTGPTPSIQQIQTAPGVQGPSGVNPSMTSPAQTIQTAPALQGPSTVSPIMTSPAPAQTIQTPPSTIQQTPGLQQSPMIKPMAPTAPITPLQR